MVAEVRLRRITLGMEGCVSVVDVSPSPFLFLQGGNLKHNFKVPVAGRTSVTSGK